MFLLLHHCENPTRLFRARQQESNQVKSQNPNLDDLH